MSDNPAKHEELIEQYLRSILDISANQLKLLTRACQENIELNLSS